MSPDQLALIHARAFATQRPWSAAEFVALLDDPLVHLLTEGHGFVLLRLIAPEAEILTLAVDPAARRAGVATRLLERANGLLHDQGGTRIFLEVSDANFPARALYEATGFTLAGRRPRYYKLPDGTTEDALILIRRLDA